MNIISLRGHWLALVVLGGALALSACGGSSSGTTPPGGGDDGGSDDRFTVRSYDATSYDNLVYVDLSTGDVVGENDAWHVALRRNFLHLNGGDSGPGNVAGALVGPQDHFYNGDGEPIASVFLNATPDSELGTLLEDYPAPGSRDWVTDALGSAFGGMGDWYVYQAVAPECNAGAGLIRENPDNGWLVRSAEGDSYARVRATEIVFCTRDGAGVDTFTFAFDVQVPGTDSFSTEATFTGSLPAAGGEICFDFDSDATVACTDDSWDVMAGFVGMNFFLRSNSGDSGTGNGGVFGPHAWAEVATWQSATIDDASGDPIPGNLYVADSSSGIFLQQPWYEYGMPLDGSHNLYPNYRVYLIDSDRTDASAPQYQLQVIGYYNPGSGHPRLRWREISTAE